MLTQRQIKLLQLLKKEIVPQRMEYFAKKLGISERSLHTDLEVLQEQGVQLEKKRGIGIRLLSEQGGILEDSVQDSQWIRRFSLIRELLFEEVHTSLNDFSQRYFVSKTSIKQDMEFISDCLLKGTEGKLVSDRMGTRLVFPSTEDRLAALTHFNQLLVEDDGVFREELELELPDGLSPYYPKEVVQVCKNILYTYIREHVDTLSEVYVQNFLGLFVAQVFLLMKGQHVLNTRRIFEKQQHAFYIESAVRLLHKASLRLGFDYKNGDVAYLSEQLLLYRFEQASGQLVDQQIVYDLIEKVSSALEVDVTHDQTLLSQLKAHIPPMLSRLKYGTYIRNPFTEQVKLEFSLVFHVLWLVMADFGQQIGVAFNEDEIAFLTIYFQLALEKSGVSRKILVVCSTGIVTSELLVTRIKHSLPSLDRLEVASSKEAAELQVHNYDLVLTTVPLQNNGEHVYMVSPFISTEELAELLQQHPARSGLDLLPKEGSLESYLDSDLIFYHPKFHSTDEAITFLSQELENKGLVGTGFQEAMIQREGLGNTDLPVGVAIPHGNPQEVEKTFVALVKCSKKFKWKDYFVDMIFVIGIHPNDMAKTKTIVSHIYQLIQSEEVLKRLRQAKSKEEVRNIVYRTHT